MNTVPISESEENGNCAISISSITDKQFGTLDLMFLISIYDHYLYVHFMCLWEYLPYQNGNAVCDAQSLRL